MNTDNKPRRASINFSPETEKILRDRAEENKRSLTKEVVWIVEQFLKREHAHESTQKV
jgi:hypothetical protein